MIDLRRLAFILLAAFAAAVSVAFTLQQYELRAATLEARNARAEADVTHRNLWKLNGHWLAVQSRLVEERQLGLDQLSATQRQIADLKHEKITSDALVRILGDSLHRHQEGPLAVVDAGTGLITATDTLHAADSLGLVAAATVRLLPGSGQPPAWDWYIVRSDVNLDLTVGCGQQNAIAHLTGPTYLTMQITKIQQDDHICVPAPSWSPLAIKLPSVPVAALLLGLGYLLHR